MSGIVSVLIESYHLYHYSGGTLEACIRCYDANLQLVGLLNFRKDDVELPENSQTSSGTIFLQYPISRINEIVNTLRYEKPVRFFFKSDSKLGSVGTGTREEIGEEEA